MVQSTFKTRLSLTAASFHCQGIHYCVITIFWLLTWSWNRWLLQCNGMKERRKQLAVSFTGLIGLQWHYRDTFLSYMRWDHAIHIFPGYHVTLNKIEHNLRLLSLAQFCIPCNTRCYLLSGDFWALRNLSKQFGLLQTGQLQGWGRRKLTVGLALWTLVKFC